MQYKVLKPVFGEGYQEGDVIEREPHAMAVHLEKGEVEPYVEPKNPEKKAKSKKK